MTKEKKKKKSRDYVLGPDVFDFPIKVCPKKDGLIEFYRPISPDKDAYLGTARYHNGLYDVHIKSLTVLQLQKLDHLLKYSTSCQTTWWLSEWVSKSGNGFLGRWVALWNGFVLNSSEDYEAFKAGLEKSNRPFEEITILKLPR